jgi:hypothetical protein
MDTDLAGLAAQQTTCGLTDNPRQFTEAPLVGILRQAWRQRYGHRDGMDYPTVPFYPQWRVIVTVMTTGAEPLALCGVVANGTANVSYLFPG